MAERPSFFARLRERLSKSREGLIGGIERLIGMQHAIDSDLLTSLEEVLLGADLGVHTTTRVLRELEEQHTARAFATPEEVRMAIKGMLLQVISRGEVDWEATAARPCVMMVIGVNGVGKTTTIAKLAYRFKQEGQRVLLAAADTFRAAAIEQLEIWAERVKVPVIKHQSGADPSAVVFDALQAFKAKGWDMLITDTAGRLHTKRNLMEELKKVKRIMGREVPGAPHEVLMVLDATTGQNALSQVRLFQQAIGVTGLVMTKLDGTAKGGVLINLVSEFGLPIRFIGFGEGLDDLQPFKAGAFIEALF